MKKYYTRACNFFYGQNSKTLVENKKALPLCGNNSISFNQIEIFIRDKNKVNSKIINVRDIKKTSPFLKKKIKKDLKKITERRGLLKNKSHILMGVLNITPDSFSDGGKFNSYEKALKRISRCRPGGTHGFDPVPKREK